MKFRIFGLTIAFISLFFSNASGRPFVPPGVAPEIRILFLGNSHTAYHDVPGMTQRLLESSGAIGHVTIRMETGATLDEVAQRKDVQKMIREGKWTWVVMQGANLSSSHNYVYSQADGIAAAKLAISSGAQALYFSEWPRQGWNETDYILGIYREMSKASGAQVVPVGKAFDAAIARQPKIQLWSPDGNHASSGGSYLAAYCIANWIAGRNPVPSTWRPSDVDEQTSRLLREVAKAALE